MLLRSRFFINGHLCVRHTMKGSQVKGQRWSACSLSIVTMANEILPWDWIAMVCLNNQWRKSCIVKFKKYAKSWWPRFSEVFPITFRYMYDLVGLSLCSACLIYWAGCKHRWKLEHHWVIAAIIHYYTWRYTYLSYSCPDKFGLSDCIISVATIGSTNSSTVIYRL